MAESIAWLSVVGISENGVEGLCPGARAAVQSAALVMGGKRHLALARELIAGEALEWPSPLEKAVPVLLARGPQPVCVLASGDPFLYGVGTRLARHIPMQQMQVFPAPSSFSLAAARLGWALQHTQTVALNGRPLAGIIPLLQPGARILALSTDGETPALLAALLAARGFGDSNITVLERLGGPQARMRTAQALAFALEDIDPLNCMAVEVADTVEAKALALPLACGLADAWFEHDGQLTKREVRAVTLSALAPRRGELLWDIGLGAGSVAIEWLLRDGANRAVGIEKNAERAARAARNAQALGVPQLAIVQGEAPAALAGLEAPDAVFIGGGGAAAGVLEAAWEALKPGGRLVANAVSLETEAALLAAQRRYGGGLIRIGLERAEPVGAMTGWRPAMTVTQWSATK